MPARQRLEFPVKDHFYFNAGHFRPVQGVILEVILFREMHLGGEGSSREAEARRIIAETLRKARLTSEGLKLLSANHRIKVGFALRLRRETTMDLKWIAQELAVGSWKYLSNLLSKGPHPSRQTEFAR